MESTPQGDSYLDLTKFLLKCDIVKLQFSDTEIS
jgi:hypothetical protein